MHLLLFSLPSPLTARFVDNFKLNDMQTTPTPSHRTAGRDRYIEEQDRLVATLCCAQPRRLNVGKVKRVWKDCKNKKNRDASKIYCPRGWRSKWEEHTSRVEETVPGSWRPPSVYQLSWVLRAFTHVRRFYCIYIINYERSSQILGRCDLVGRDRALTATKLGESMCCWLPCMHIRSSLRATKKKRDACILATVLYASTLFNFCICRLCIVSSPNVSHPTRTPPQARRSNVDWDAERNGCTQGLW